MAKDKKKRSWLNRYISPYIYRAAYGAKDVIGDFRDFILDPAKETRDFVNTAKEYRSVEKKKEKLKKELYDRSGPTVRKDIESGDLKFKVDPYYPAGAYYNHRLNRYPAQPDTVGVTQYSDQDSMSHEAAHHIWFDKMTAKDKDEFLTDLQKELRRRNEKGESVADISKALRHYEDAIERGFYRGGTDERSTEWHAYLGDALPYMATKKAVPFYYKPPRMPIIPPFDPKDQMYSIAEKYPGLMKYYEGLYEPQWLREYLREQRYDNRNDDWGSKIMSPESARK